jgi:biotin-(acetyl-CoA carboxylase) ligase
LTNKNITALKHSAYSPDLVPDNFYLSPRPTLALKKRRFCDATDIIKNVMEELKRLSQNCLQECFQHIYSSWQQCIASKGDYFEGYAF